MAKYRITPSSRTIVQSPISIGHKAEKGVEAIEFDLTAWVETYGSGTLTVIMRRWGDAIPYPIALEIDENNKATWTLSDIDTAKAGMAYAQLSYVVGETVVKKSDIYTFRVMDSLTGEGEPPEAYESWLEHLTHFAAEAMAEVLDIEGIVTDKTLTVDGGIADAKATGDALALKADKSTTYTKTEVDQMIEDVEVETDTTLGITGAPADAAETGRQIGLIKADFDDVVSDITRKMEYVRSENLCRGDDTVTSGYMDKSGNVYSNDSYVYTDKIPVNEGETIRAYNTQSGTFAQRAMRFVTAFDSAGNVVSASGLDNGWNYPVPTGIKSIIVTIAVGSNYMVAVGAVVSQYKAYNAYYKATEDFIGNLLVNALSSKVDKTGIKQVTSDNIADLVKTGSKTKSANIFSDADLLGTGKYIDTRHDNGKLILHDNANYDSYIIAVDGSNYQLSGARFALLLESDMETTVGSVLSNVTEVVTTGASYLAFSFAVATYSADTFVVTKTLDVYANTNWIFGDTKKPIDKKSGSISQNGTMSISGRSALKDGEVISFKGFFDSFGGFKLNFYGRSTTNYIEITDSSISIKNNNNTPTPVSHGLTIENDVSLIVEFINGTAKISLYSMGDVYTQTVTWYQTSGTVTEPQIESVGMAFADAVLSVSYDASMRSLWYFGDSYISVDNSARWAYYLLQNEYLKNILLNGSAGSTSSGACTALTTLIKYGTPKYAVMATGMNDGSDSNGNPSTLWSTSRDAFIALCESSGIEPIFATVPTVPSVNNEAKNAWVKASGYRYIDFAKAVGADGTGSWYSGMLSSDNVHPTEKGAKALYTQVLIDLPEITLT